MRTDPTAWLDARLASAGRRRTGALELVRERPWGAVWAAPTDAGRVWVKRPGPDNTVEVPLLARLARLDAPLLPEVLGAGDGLLALADAGRPFREVYADRQLLAPVTAALVDLGRLQRSSADLVPDLLGIGVPDLRPAALPDVFDELVAALGPVPDRAGARAALVDVTAELATSAVPAGLDHNDVHGGNLLRAAGGRTVAVDWGDTVVAHPFTTLLVPSRALAAAVGADVDRAWAVPEVAAARRAYLAGFAAGAPGEDLERTARLAGVAAHVVRVWIWRRAVVSAQRVAGGEADVASFTAHGRSWLTATVAALAATRSGNSRRGGQ